MVTKKKRHASTAEVKERKAKANLDASASSGEKKYLVQQQSFELLLRDLGVGAKEEWFEGYPKVAESLRNWIDFVEDSGDDWLLRLERQAYVLAEHLDTLALEFRDRGVKRLCEAFAHPVEAPARSTVKYSWGSLLEDIAVVYCGWGWEGGTFHKRIIEELDFRREHIQRMGHDFLVLADLATQEGLYLSFEDFFGAFRASQRLLTRLYYIQAASPGAEKPPFTADQYDRVKRTVEALGKESKPSKIIETAGVAPRACREALRCLEYNREYGGFGRHRPARYQRLGFPTRFLR